jgi:hypothetical protein
MEDVEEAEAVEDSWAEVANEAATAAAALAAATASASLACVLELPLLYEGMSMPSVAGGGAVDSPDGRSVAVEMKVIPAGPVSTAPARWRMTPASDEEVALFEFTFVVASAVFTPGSSSSSSWKSLEDAAFFLSSSCLR